MTVTPTAPTPPSTASHSPHPPSGAGEVLAQEVIDWFERLTPQSLAHLGRYFAADARFVDPFNDVQGLPAIRAVFEHMFTALHEPRFIVTNRVQQGHQVFVTWVFQFRFRRGDETTLQTIHGATHWVFNRQGHITLHRDYWDAAQELYEKLPLVGGLMRWLKRRVNAG